MKRLCIAGALALLLAADPVLAQRPTVRVTFQVVEASFANTFGPRRRALERRAADVMASKLDSVARFAKFVTAGRGDYELRFSLDRRHRGTSGRDEVGVWATLSLPGSNELYWKYRDSNEYSDARGNEVAFFGRLNDVANRGALRNLVNELLTKIPLPRAQDIRPWAPLGWILPFKHTDLCLEPASTFRIYNSYRTRNGLEVIDIVAVARTVFNPRPLSSEYRPYQRNVLATAVGNSNAPAALRDAITRRTVTVQRILVVDYQMDPSCSGPTPPGAAF